MRIINLLLLCLLLNACNDDATTQTDDDGGTESTTPSVEKPKGKLYLQSYIVGGLKISWLWLGDDGQFAYNPVMGADPIHMDIEKEKNAANSGTYTKNGNNLEVTYFTGKKETWALEYDGGKLKLIDGWFVEEQEGMPDDYRLEGSFTGNFYMSYVSKSITYTFRKDGTLSMGSTATVNVDGAGGTATGNPDEGIYRINGNTLNIKMNNGDQSIALIGIIPGDKPSVIINYSMYK